MIKKIKKIIRKNIYKYSDPKLKKIIKWEIKHGYIETNGRPIKCIYCNSEELEDFDEYYLDGYGSHLLEYSVRCKKCGKTAGIWSYGSWQIY